MNNFLDNDIDYWRIADTIKGIYTSDGSISVLLDFERVLSKFHLYAFKNWDLGELVHGPVINRYLVTCVFMWPEELMPDPSGGTRLLPYDCTVKYKKTTIRIPTKIKTPNDYIPGTKRGKLIEKKVWLVEITIPRDLMDDIKTGSIDLEDEDTDMPELDRAYDQDLDKAEVKTTDNSGLGL